MKIHPDPNSPAALIAAGAPKFPSYGHIALQAECQPVWFRHIEIRSLGQDE